MGLRIGILGTGTIAETHAAILQADRRARITTLFNPNRQRALRFAERFGGLVCESAHEAIAGADATLITSPNHTHAEYTRIAVRAGKHVLCEKPFAISTAEARDIAAEVDRAGVVYQLGFNRRFAPAYLAMKRMLETGGITPTSFAVKMNRGDLRQPLWTGDTDVTGGFLFETTLHALDMIRYLLGEVAEVQALGSTNVYTCVDNFSLLIRMQSGAHGVLTSCAHASWTYPFERVELFSDHATIVNHELDTVSRCEGPGHQTTTGEYRRLSEAERWGFVAQDRTFLDRVLGQPPRHKCWADHHDGLRNVEIIETIYDQVGLGR